MNGSIFQYQVYCKYIKEADSMSQKAFSVLLATAFLVGVGYKAVRHVFPKSR